MEFSSPLQEAPYIRTSFANKNVLTYDKNDKSDQKAQNMLISSIWGAQSSKANTSPSGALSVTAERAITKFPNPKNLQHQFKDSGWLSKEKLCQVKYDTGNKDPAKTAKKSSPEVDVRKKRKRPQATKKQTKGGSQGKETCSSFAKYGIRMPSFEDILREKENFKIYKESLENASLLDDDSSFEVPSIKKIIDTRLQPKRSVLDCKKMTEEEIVAAFEDNLTYLSDICSGREYSERDEHFRSRKLDRLHHLTHNTSMILFSYEQKLVLASLLCKEFESYGDQYYFKVLLPELCLKIFMDRFDMSRHEAAQYMDERPVRQEHIKYY